MFQLVTRAMNVETRRNNGWSKSKSWNHLTRRLDAASGNGSAPRVLNRQGVPRDHRGRDCHQALRRVPRRTTHGEGYKARAGAYPESSPKRNQGCRLTGGMPVTFRDDGRQVGRLAINALSRTINAAVVSSFWLAAAARLAGAAGRSA